MATIKKVTVGATTYDVEDASARAQLENTEQVQFNGTTTATTEALNNIIVGTKTYNITSGPTYTAGENIQISDQNVISATDTTYTAGTNVQINNNVISATDTTYSPATTSANGLMSSTDKTKLNGIATGATNVTEATVSGWGFTKNAGTVTGVKMNGSTKSPTSGVVDLGTVITEHQSLAAYRTSADQDTIDNTKVDKVTGKGLSTNDYTSAEKTKLAGIEEGANNYTLPIASASALGGVKVGSHLSINSTTGVLDAAYSDATTSASGLMSSSDKTKLNGIADGATNVTESTVSGWGFTKNAGTVTAVAVKMNGSTKGTVTSSGTIDLGTVITAHQSLSDYATKTYVDTADALKQNITDNTLATTAKTIPAAINEVNDIAKGAQKAVAFDNIQAMVNDLNAATATKYNLGQSIYIRTLTAPDVWISSVESTSVTYTYTTDQAFIDALKVAAVQIGYYKVSQLETGKIDISGKEDKTNKVTSMSGSSTDVQYPSAKAVYTALSGKQNTLTAGTGISIVNNVISVSLENANTKSF